LRPDKRQLREYGFQPLAIMADFDHQPSVGRQLPCRLVQDYAHRVKTVRAAGECELRLTAVFGRQRAHGGGADIGRIGDDQVVTLAAQC